jgi:hypothetical protein
MDVTQDQWVNELGSVVSFGNPSPGVLAGTYESKVGKAPGSYALLGSYDDLGVEGSNSVAFCVTWSNAENNSHSSTAWAGQFQQDGAGACLVATWLLVGETAGGDDWDSTTVGQDVFRPVKQGWSPRKSRALSNPA